MRANAYSSVPRSQVLKWYQARNKDITPIHPVGGIVSNNRTPFTGIQKEDELEGLKTIRSIAELPAPAETSISIVTPPKVSCSVFIPDNVLED